MSEEDCDIQKEIEYYSGLPVIFNEYMEVPELKDDEIELICTNKAESVVDNRIPAYTFEIRKGGISIGAIGLRIGYSDVLYYSGNIGYSVDEKHRGKNYAGRACRLLASVMKAHGMKTALITNNHTNKASKRVCEKLGARLVRVAEVPEWHDLYKDGDRFENIYEWDIE